MNVMQFLDFLGVTELWNNIKAFVLGQVVELTQAEYDALNEEEKMSGVTYYITDTNNESYVSASEIAYNNLSSGLSSTNVADAIDELASTINQMQQIYVNEGTLNLPQVSASINNGTLSLGISEGGN